MSIDGRILAKAKELLEERKRAHTKQHEDRLNNVYARCPRIASIDREIKATVIDAVGQALRKGQDTDSVIAELADKNLNLQSERIQVLISAGFPPDYLEDEYICNRCHDTGYVGTEICSCLMDLYKKELKASLSSLLKLGDETFDNFDLCWYDDAYEPALGMSPRAHMEGVCEMCYRYANKFSDKSTNLFLNGSTGLGKTFLSASIARVVAEKGYSVVYDMAGSIFSAFEDEKFSKSEDTTASRQGIRRYLESDLLIIDDLGTEMTTAFTISALYELINTRLLNFRKTIINSNLTIDELTGRYSTQIASRIKGEYRVLRFYGNDIRLLKNGL